MSASSGKAMWFRLFHLDSTSDHSLQRQLRQCLVKAILDGHIPLDEALPSSRELSRQLGVARNTVVLAYQHLIDDGYLVARERRGYFVNEAMLAASRVTSAVSPETEGAGPVRSPEPVFDVLSQRNIERPHDWQHFEFPFIYGQNDPALFPVNDWREACRLSLRVDAIRRWTDDKVDHDDELLVEQILTRVLPRRGVWADKDQLLITAGAQNALYLIAQLLLDRESTMGIENPCYVDARNIFSLFTPRMETFDVGDDGVQIDERLKTCKLLYVTPSHQCPTTATMPLENRRQLLRDAYDNDVWIIEDDYESELNFVGEPTPALKSLDSHQSVLYVGSLSKSLAPGLRIGFLVGPAPLIAQARALRRLMYRHPASNNQRTVGQFLALGHHDSALLRRQHTFRKRWRLMRDALSRHTPLLSAVTPSFGGSSFWVQLPDTVDAVEFEMEAAANGIIINAGTCYFSGPHPPRNYCRLGFSAIADDRIEPGMQRLAGLLS